jgi:CsoR family transcriptional regulator, copper-sensing transcriptional repressor
MTIGNERDKAAMTLRLKRVEGQLRGIQKMIEEDADCERIAQQMSAARKGLDRAFYEMVACMLEHQLTEEVGRKPQVHARIGEMTSLLAKFA